MDSAISRSNAVDLAWLGGLLDGEGCFTISRKSAGPRYTKQQFQYSPMVFLVNCDVRLINEADRILSAHGINARIIERPPQQPHYKPPFHVEVGGLAKVERMTALMLPYLRGKRAEAELLHRFVAKRIARNLAQSKHLNPYDDEEMAIFDQLKKLKRHESSEAIRSAPPIGG